MLTLSQDDCCRRFSHELDTRGGRRNLTLAGDGSLKWKGFRWSKKITMSMCFDKVNHPAHFMLAYTNLIRSRAFSSADARGEINRAGQVISLPLCSLESEEP